jgi:hypothetical protein
MGSEAKKWFSAAPAFDPAEGTTVIEPPGTETGYWAGALSAVYDDSAGEFYLYYRVRRPIGKGRGWQCHVARSTDGSHFSTVWTATKEQFGTESFEGGPWSERRTAASGCIPAISTPPIEDGRSRSSRPPLPASSILEAGRWS